MFLLKAQCSDLEVSRSEVQNEHTLLFVEDIVSNGGWPTFTFCVKVGTTKQAA
jgi:hypothetical protein